MTNDFSVLAMGAVVLYSAGAMAYVYRWRGRTRYASFSQYLRKSWPVFAPLNCLMYMIMINKASINALFNGATCVASWRHHHLTENTRRRSSIASSLSGAGLGLLIIQSFAVSSSSSNAKLAFDTEVSQTTGPSRSSMTPRTSFADCATCAATSGEPGR